MSEQYIAWPALPYHRYIDWQISLFCEIFTDMCNMINAAICHTIPVAMWYWTWTCIYKGPFKSTVSAKGFTMFATYTGGSAVPSKSLSQKLFTHQWCSVGRNFSSVSCLRTLWHADCQSSDHKISPKMVHGV